jgi:hypothetical protein
MVLAVQLAAVHRRSGDRSNANLQAGACCQGLAAFFKRRLSTQWGADMG